MHFIKPLALATLSFLAACGSESAVKIVGNEVQVSTTQLDITFARETTVNDAFMIFGGLDSDRGDMSSKITIVGLAMTDARPIHEDYPDFYRCNSGGAEAAKSATRQLDIVPLNDKVLTELQTALAQHNAGLGSGGDRVCVQLTGAMLSWKSAKVEGEEVLNQLPPQVKRPHLLVESARIVPASAALAAAPL